jgi:ribosomal protein S12 methylthiotransferase accessory factor
MCRRIQMDFEMKVSFPGGLKVDADFLGFTVKTDQAVKSGGEASAPAPFDLFLASLGTCAGYYVLRFLEKRNIPSKNAGITMTLEKDEQKKKLGKIKMKIHVPPEFPEKYRQAVINAAETCTVKKTIADPPEFEFETEVGDDKIL